jgi:hypothetical protein
MVVVVVWQMCVELPSGGDFLSAYAKVCDGLRWLELTPAPTALPAKTLSAHPKLLALFNSTATNSNDVQTLPS